MKKIALSAVAVFVTTVAILVATPAFAGSSPYGVRVPSSAPRIRAKNGASTNWSGYAVETDLLNPQSNAVSDVGGSWTVPALACGSVNTYSAAWVGIDGYSDNTVEQLGTEEDCVSGSSIYSAWYEMYPKNSVGIRKPVKSGDVMNAAVSYLGRGSFRLTLNDVTEKWSYSTTQKSGSAKRESAEWIMEAPWSGGVLPLANFGTIGFTSVSVTMNGNAGTVNGGVWQYDPITMVNVAGSPKATPSSLSSDGSSFSIAWDSSN